MKSVYTMLGVSLGFTITLAFAEFQPVTPVIQVPKASLRAEELAIIVNDNDPASVEIAEYYRRRRHIPEKNTIHVRIDPSNVNLPSTLFNQLWPVVKQQTPVYVQAYVLTWTKPYKVDCMGITAAFAFGFDPRYCASGCRMTAANPYFSSQSKYPYDDYKFRPSMMLAGKNLAEVKRLIDRGIHADHTYPQGTGYLLSTTDASRTVRDVLFAKIKQVYGGFLHIEALKQNYITGKKDVLFYFTGSKFVSKLTSNNFLPGAIADHLTSSGGQLTDSQQMSILEWLSAGATGSYGTVAEPCNIPGKFPNPAVVIDRYINGESLIEAYWKSVDMPGQGVFVGEPLARPYGDYQMHWEGDDLVYTTWELVPGEYEILGGQTLLGPFTPLPGVQRINPGQNTLRFSHSQHLVYRLVKKLE
ncbi:MAG: TIGR03790 family protein [Gammaproteobacteria bacterium]|nr:TIGR03790 family protein [Gammaproteobacteria bacterium]